MLIHKHIIRSMVYPIFMMLIVFLFLMWITQSLRFLDLVVTRGIDFSAVLHITSSLLPSLVSIVLPISVSIGAIFCYNKMMCDNEIIVLKSTGFSNYDLVKPVIKIGLACSLFGYFLSMYVVPVASANFIDQKSFFQKQYAAMVLREGVFTEPIKGLSIYIDQIINNQTFKGIMVNDKRVKNKDITLIAKEARVISSSDQMVLDLVNGNRQEKTNEKINILYFDNFPVNITNYISEKVKKWKEPSERNIFELMEKEIEKPEMQGKINSELHNRFIWPMLSFILPFMAVTIMLSGRYSRTGYYKAIILSGVAALFVIMLIVINNSLISRNSNFSILSYSLLFLSGSFSWAGIKKMDNLC
jgi:lipopolysaccharide export system permease protein